MSVSAGVEELALMIDGVRIGWSDGSSGEHQPVSLAERIRVKCSNRGEGSEASTLAALSTSAPAMANADAKGEKTIRARVALMSTPASKTFNSTCTPIRGCEQRVTAVFTGISGAEP